MPIISRNCKTTKAGTPFPERKDPDALPALFRQRDLALLGILVVVVGPQIRGMEFAKGAVFFYWFLAFVTLQIPIMCVFRWMVRQAPAHVPFYIWILRLLDERWRSVLVSLTWWCGVLIILSTIGICFDLLQLLFPSWFRSVLVQGTLFLVLLTLVTVFATLPVHRVRIILWIGGLCFLGFFGLMGLATLVFLIRLHITSGTPLHPALTVSPQHFSWSLFGLALLCQLGINLPLFLDGELGGTQRFLRRSPTYLWWAGSGVLLLLLVSTTTWVVIRPDMQGVPGRLYPFAGLILGQNWAFASWSLLFLGSIGSALAFFFLFSRAFLMAARQHYLPHALTQLNRVGTPIRTVITLSLFTFGAALLLLVIVPALLRTFVPFSFLNDLSTSDHFGLLSAIAGSLWCLLTALLFLFALWLCWKKRRSERASLNQCLVLTGMCVSGSAAALICAFAPFLPDWPSLFFSRTHWFPLILGGFACSLALAWVIGELPRRSALVREREKRLANEKVLREELQRAYHQQHMLLEEVNRLYREQERMARTDQITGLLNRRAFLECLEGEIAHYHEEARDFLLLFLDLDHFKAINDTWGHRAGDAVLSEAAQRIRQALRPGDTVGRYGGEEFTVILVDKPIDDAQKEGERLCQLLRSASCDWQCLDKQRIGIPVTASIGIAAFDGTHSITCQDLLESADQAMYQAKLAGRDCVRIAGE